MKVWLDDYRSAPDGWHWAKSVSDVQELFKDFDIEELHLDHDLGSRPEGYDHAAPSGSVLVAWMLDTGNFPSKRIAIHSVNRQGRFVMLETLLAGIERLRLPIRLTVQPLPDAIRWQDDVPPEWWQ